MADKMMELGWLLTKYITLPLLIIGVVVWIITKRRDAC